LGRLVGACGCVWVAGGGKRGLGRLVGACVGEGGRGSREGRDT